MRLFVSGSAPLSAETHREWETRTGHRILERYGMTETGMLSSNPYAGDRRAGSVGPPLPGVDIRIAARGADGVGGIEVRGPNVTSGYWRDPDKTAESFTADGFFQTGDLGRFDEDGYLWIVGRAKDLIISGGFNVYPAEVHMRIASPPTRHSCFYGVDTPERTKLLAAKLDVPGMSDYIHADSLAFVSIAGLYKALGHERRADVRPQHCDACFTGDYPTTLTDQDELAPADQLSLLAERIV